MKPGTKVEYKGEMLIGAKQVDAGAHARKLGVGICELCPLHGQPECNNGPYDCHGIVWMHEKEFVIMELTR